MEENNVKEQTRIFYRRTKKKKNVKYVEKLEEMENKVVKEQTRNFYRNVTKEKGIV